jgi:ribosome biogenesis GTPase
MLLSRGGELPEDGAMDLNRLGWTPALDYYMELLDDPDLVPGRVAVVHRGRCEVEAAAGRREAAWHPPVAVVDGDPVDAPASGDWCALAPGEAMVRLVSLLPRRTCLVRGGSDSRRGRQALAANVDLVLIVTGLDGDFSPRRIERYLALVRSSGASPMVLLNKADACPDPGQALDRARAVTRELEPLLISAREDSGLEPVRQALGPGTTAVLVGSSGAGKSTLLNRLLGRAVQATAPVRAGDQRGRHTTTRRELLVLPGGGLMIDTPGIREVSLLPDEHALDQVFDEIEELSAGCRFSDCTHEGEPGCAVVSAVEQGALAEDRLQSYLRLRREQQAARLRQDEAARRAHERATWGNIRVKLRESRRFKGDI